MRTMNCEMDMEPRYTPDRVVLCECGMSVHRRVTEIVFHRAGTHNGPLMKDYDALELKTSNGSRWYGVKNAYINSELRMVAVGFPAAFEEMAKWEKVPADRLV